MNFTRSWYILEKNQEYRSLPDNTSIFHEYMRNGWNIFSGPYEEKFLADQHIPKRKEDNNN